MNRKTKTPSLTLDNTYKQNICQHSYIGKKGYTISKNIISKEDLAFLYKDLFVKPEIFGFQKNSTEANSFPMYRENDNKIYIPRFYGIRRYGLPDNHSISSGNNIQLTFAKSLRDYQTHIVNVFLNHVNTKVCNLDDSLFGNGGILEVPCGFGKTIMALNIISVLCKKTLIIVHKEFLMDQWIERIQEFLPTAKIGKIQGSTFDIEDKDIVIGMIQTMYDRTYPSNAFDSFGLTVIDEVHRIGSEQFSKTLFKTITPYMLGISATVERKDKLTKILYMFIGDKIYSQDRKDEDCVVVRTIEYKNRDPEFNQSEVDFKGNTKYSTMITKLCNFNPRSDFIVTVMRNLVEEIPTSQIMVLSHNRSLLTYLHDSIVQNNITTVGYYVGGMKKEDLQETESKQIVLATYAMAAEALDIKTLSILVMATPKTDIIQSVGRILRVKHEQPIIVDILDTHDVFQNQYIQRKRFYKKCNYKIIKCDSNQYNNTETNWITVFDSKNKVKEDKPPAKCLIDTSIFKNL
tara:strand:- start:650 stop:2203 length:1554 start_codon:yes stop_codon:yes gene_type:complete